MYYPLFKHNDLKPNNILIQKNDIDKYEYFLEDKKFCIENKFKIEAKIWDFDFSCIGNKINNEKLNSKYIRKNKINNHHNTYYDCYYFLKSLQSWHDFKDQLKFSELNDFFNDIIIDDALCNNKNRLFDDINFLNVQNILNHKFFESYKIHII